MDERPTLTGGINGNSEHFSSTYEEAIAWHDEQVKKLESK